MTQASEAGGEEPRSSTPTIVAVAITAYALCDLVHEVAGHAFAALMVPGVRVVSLSTVALQTTGNSRIVASAGSIAQVLVGAVAFGLFHRLARFSATGYFLWLFGSVNLLNGSGYLFYSGVLGSGDWEVVIRGQAFCEGTHANRANKPCLARGDRSSSLFGVRGGWCIAPRGVSVQSDKSEPHPHIRFEQRVRGDGRTHLRSANGRESNSRRPSRKRCRLAKPRLDRRGPCGRDVLRCYRRARHSVLEAWTRSRQA